MNEKISEEMKKKLIDGIDITIDNYGAIDWEASNELTEKNWRSAGLLEPEEDALELELVLDKWISHFTSDGRVYEHIPTLICDLRKVKASITRLKASAWTEGDIKAYVNYCDVQLYSGRDILSPSEWLAQRRAGKGAE